MCVCVCVCVCVWFVLRYGQKGSLSSHNSNVLTGLFHWLSPPPKKNTATSYKPPPPNSVAWASRYCSHPWLSTDPLTLPAISCIQEGNVSSQRPARWPGTSFTILCQWVSCCGWSLLHRWIAQLLLHLLSPSFSLPLLDGHWSQLADGVELFLNFVLLSYNLLLQQRLTFWIILFKLCSYSR